MKLKRDTKFGGESTCRLKIRLRNLTNFDLSSQKCQRFSLEWASCEQSYIFDLKKYRGVIFHETREEYKI